ncbi:MAG: GNAT family N-acetyltransferase [Puniceicoccales bacterium]|jgi:phosphinothricin acetyltransferase|nr:GNAT family N-acetyltransferase [Puniceicoccales bacterium]
MSAVAVIVPRIRPAEQRDAAAITHIYNDSVLHSAATFQIAPDNVETRRVWLKRRKPEHPVFVAELAGAVVAWASLSPYSLREAWQHTVEDSIYLDGTVRGKGLGAAMLGHLLTAARAHGHRVVLARIVADHAASIGLHAKLGFVERGRLLGVGLKCGRWHDVVYMQKDLTPPNG